MKVGELRGKKNQKDEGMRCDKESKSPEDREEGERMSKKRTSWYFDARGTQFLRTEEGKATVLLPLPFRNLMTSNHAAHVLPSPTSSPSSPSYVLFHRSVCIYIRFSFR